MRSGRRATATGDKILMATPAGILAFGQVLDGRRGGKPPESVALGGAELIDGFLRRRAGAQTRRATNNIASAEMYLKRYVDGRRATQSGRSRLR